MYISGYSFLTADSNLLVSSISSAGFEAELIPCKQARRLNIDTNDMDAEQIVSAVKSAKVGFQDNSSNSKGPGGVPDKKYDLSTYGSVDDCVNGPNGLVSLGVDSSRALSECQTYFQVGTTGGKNASRGKATYDGIAYGRNLKDTGDLISRQTKEYYSNVCSAGSRNASVSNSNEIEVPSYITLSGDEYVRKFKSMVAANSSNNLKGLGLTQTKYRKHL